jgi:hypothetical protein
MDGERFDRLTRTLTASRSRRVTLGGLAAGILLSLSLALDETTLLAKKNKGKGKKKKKNKKKDCPPGRRCGTRCCPPGQTCQDGQCLCSFGREPCGNECCTLGETCDGGQCVHHCVDGSLNGGESDTDCGRVCDGVFGASPAGRCGLRKRCAGPEDCTSAKCQEPQPGTGLQCVECLIDSDCTSPVFRRCLDNFCFECAIDADCPSPFNAGSDFDLCVVIEDCPRNQPCVCRQCRQDSDCPPERPHCDTGTDSISGKLCNECLEDAHCPPSQLCNQGPGTCEGFECDNDDDCPPDRPLCINGTCQKCDSDTDCPVGQTCAESGSCVPLQQCEVDSDCPGGFCLDCCVDCGDGSHCFPSAVCP